MEPVRAPMPALKRVKPLPVDRLIRPFQDFARFGAAGGIVLMLSAIAAFVIAQTEFYEAYHKFFLHVIKIGLDEWIIDVPIGKSVKPLTLELFINDALMAIFFLFVGLEIKRELLVGELSSLRRAAMPFAAAAGGMVVPGLIYAAINWGTPQVNGWGAAVATDIAFALGVLMLLGSRVPASLKVFLTSLAIVDDLGALGVIAIFYTEQLNIDALRNAGIVVAILMAHNLLGVKKIHPYLLLGLPLWYFVLESGVHATIAGILLAATIPARQRIDPDAFLESNRNALDVFEQAKSQTADVRRNRELIAAARTIELNCEHIEPPLHRLEHKLAGLCAFFIIPVFAFANAGVHVGAETELTGRVTLGIVAGLVIGKPLGVMAACFLAFKLRLGDLPRGVNWHHLHGAAWLAGIGFTMSLFIANLAFKASPENLDQAKIGILAASILAGTIGLSLLLLTSKKTKNTEEQG
ncbi:MAG: Na+/H+ antiporter NhaA [Phycisphaerales bacterium JB059]